MSENIRRTAKTYIYLTTEKHKIIPTILSRCQIFDFKRITVKDAKEHLAEVATSQGIIFEDDASYYRSEQMVLCAMPYLF
jgi:DNA polymerase III gamma/tau subunit